MARPLVGQHHFVQSALPAVIVVLLTAALLLAGIGVAWDRTLEHCARSIAMRIAPGSRAIQELDLAVGDFSRAALIAVDTGDRRIIDEARGRLDSAAAVADGWAQAAHVADPEPASVAAMLFEDAVERAMRPGNPDEEREMHEAVDAMTTVLRSNTAIVAEEATAALEQFSSIQRWRRWMEMAVMALVAGGCFALLYVLRRREARACAEEAQSFQRLIDSNADLEAFAGRVAHDLRNPLVPILSGSQIIEHSEIDARARRAAERIERAARRLSRMIDMLLDFSRQTARGSPPTECDARAVVVEVVEGFSDRAAAEGVQLVVEAQPLRCACEPIVLASPLQNLIENALKYGHREGVPPLVEVRACARGGMALVEIEDNGPGISPRDAEQLFRAFCRGVDGGDGVGLGLATARRLVEARGGSIGLRVGRHGGALFQIRLPLAPPDGQPLRDRPMPTA